MQLAGVCLHAEFQKLFPALQQWSFHQRVTSKAHSLAEHAAAEDRTVN